MENPNPNFIPLSILVAGALIAGAIYFGGGTVSQLTASGTGALPSVNNVADSGGSPSVAGTQGGDQVNIKPVDDQDHIRGNADAPVKIVEFSDYECPFCNSVHPTLKQVVEEYNGQVAWVYRQFPLESIHPRARAAAEGSECVAALGGNDAFWAFTDKIFEDQQTNLSQLASVAESIGVNAAAFQNCLDSKQYSQAVDDDLADAAAAGGRGTPYSIVIAPNGKTYAVSGAQPYATFKSIIDIALNDK